MNNSAQDDVTLEAMARALSLAALSPEVGRNPRVGCVLLDGTGTIVAEGHHRGAGHPHAEVEALRDARAKGVDTRGLTAVITMEPCNHQGTTGPCSVALHQAGITRVVFAASDPGEHSGGGEHTLRDAGVDVISGVWAQQAEELNRHWFAAMRQQRPFVTAKWAQSLDGRSAATDHTSQWITGEESRNRVHEQRAKHGVIMVGTSTALIDNPQLTARTAEGGLAALQPHAVVMGLRDVPHDSAVRAHPGGFQQIRTHDPQQALDELFGQGFRSVYVEGGTTLISAFVHAGLIDEYHITMGPMLLGGKNPAVDDIGVNTIGEAKALTISSVETLGKDVWVVATPTQAKEE